MQGKLNGDKVEVWEGKRLRAVELDNNLIEYFFHAGETQNMEEIDAFIDQFKEA